MLLYIIIYNGGYNATSLLIKLYIMLMKIELINSKELFGFKQKHAEIH